MPRDKRRPARDGGGSRIAKTNLPDLTPELDEHRQVIADALQRMADQGFDPTTMNTLVAELYAWASELAGQLYPRRARPDNHERQPTTPRGRIGLTFSHLERAENPAAELECVIDRFHPWRIVSELRVPEVRLARAGGDDQRVVRDLTTLTNRLDRDAAGVEIDIDHCAEDHARVPLAAQHVTNRQGDIALGEYSRSDLMQQRLNQVVIRPVDDGDINGGAP